MVNKPKYVKDLSSQLCSVHREGMQVEILGEGGEITIATVVADDDEQLWLELYQDSEAVRVPLLKFEELLAKAKQEVHGESFYPYPENDEDVNDT